MVIEELIQNPEGLSIAALEELCAEYPYFAVPYIGLSQKQSHDNYGKIAYRFNANPVLLATNIRNDHKIVFNTNDEIINQNESEIVPEINIEKDLNNIMIDDFLAATGNSVSNELPTIDDLDALKISNNNNYEESDNDPMQKSLLVQMTFGEWLRHISHNKKMEREEEEEQRALKNRWRQEKLAAAIQEELEEIPDEVFQKAVDSISNEDDTPSESLANIYVTQGKYDKAINIYKKLILLFPEKKPYFATQLDNIKVKKDKL